MLASSGRLVSEAEHGQEGSDEEDGSLSAVSRRLKEQQQTLQGILNMQVELQKLVRAQHRDLELRLGYLRRPSGDSSCPVDGEGSSIDRGFGRSRSVYSHLDDTPSAPPSTVGLYKTYKRAKKEASFHLENATGVVPLLKKILNHPLFDTVMGAVILINFATLFVELQWRSYDLEYKLGMSASDNGWSDLKPVFKLIERLFNGIYLVELMLQFFVFRMSVFCRGWLHLADMLAIFLSTVDSFILDPLVDNDRRTRAVSVMRLIKVLRSLRLLRFLRVLRLMSTFHSIRVLVRTINSCVGSLLWSMAVVSFFILSSALLISQLTNGFVEDDTQDLNSRKWVFQYFGSATRSTYTMFEGTFSGAWATRFGRPLIDEVSSWFKVFFIFYTVTINFALTRIVGALFLKQTMDIAAIDSERMANARNKEHDRHIKVLQQIFEIGDQAKDGVLRKWEFEQMMEKNEVLDLLEEIELEPPELYMLYNLLCEEDGYINKDEFFAGALKLKKAVTSVDIVQLLHEQIMTRQSMLSLEEGLHQVDKGLHPGRPWRANHKSFRASPSPAKGESTMSGESPVVKGESTMRRASRDKSFSHQHSGGTMENALANLSD